MKKSLLVYLLVLLVGVSLQAQPVNRNMVIMEIATGTWCTYCPGAANGAHQLLNEGKNVAVIENHNGDPFANTFSNARNSYYAVPGYPTACFDGTASYSGGAACPTGNIYNTYIGMYNTAIAKPSPVSLCFSGSNTGDNYTIKVSVTKHSALVGNDLRLHVLLTESHIPQNWQGCMTECNEVTRLMVPSQNGTSMSFNSGDIQVFTLNFTKDASWNTANCELVVFLQDNNTKEIFNGKKSDLTALPASSFTLNDFTASSTSGCAPLNVSFNTTQNPGVTYSWSFPGGSPTTSSLPAPTIQYNNSGSFDVLLIGSDGECSDIKTKTNYISALAAPDAPQRPTGISDLCINPGNQVYSIIPVPNTDTYNWELSPPQSGVLINNGLSCTVNWDDAWLGTAQIKVSGSNICGTGSFSLPLNVNINPYPGQCPAPTGALTMCANPPTNEYLTAGIAGATYYVWELLPANAGNFFQGSTDIDIDWNESFSGTATLRVKANSGVCEGEFSAPISIVVNPLPNAYAVIGGGAYCGLNGGGIELGLAGSEVNTNYKLFVNNTPSSTTIAGTGNAISFGNQLAAGTYIVQATNQATCVSDMSGSAVITIDPQLPEKPATPSGPSNVITLTTPTSEFVTAGATYATTYLWNIIPSTAGSFNGNGTIAPIDWNAAYSGVATINVQGINTCGTGISSTELSTKVNFGVNLDENQSAKYQIEPNPAKNIVYIRSAHSTLADVTFIDNTGKIVLSKSKVSFNGNTKFDISKLKSGLYTVHIYSDNTNTYSLKLVVE